MARTQLHLSDANRELQDTLQRGEPRIVAAYALIGAILLFGGVGYALDRWLASAPWALIGGVLIGLVIGFANLIASLRRV
jgi:F0F1-type ATP synthase assembly protein I